MRRSSASERGRAASSDCAAEIARPRLAGRPSPSPCQNGIRPVSPKAGETVTREAVISSMRQLLVPSVITSPRRDS